MKNDYADQGFVDADDIGSQKAIAQGLVPPGCLKGGEVLVQYMDRHEDPCASCATDRKKCGGRPQLRPAPKDSAAGDNDSPGARRMRFARYIAALDELMPPARRG